MLFVSMVIGAVLSAAVPQAPLALPAHSYPLLSMPVGYQPPEIEHRDDKYKDDPNARCVIPEVADFYKNPSTHACTCHTPDCEVTPDGINYWYDHTCELSCSPKRCACHPDNDTCGAPMIEEPKK